MDIRWHNGSLIFKIAVVGKPDVGKTTFIKSFFRRLGISNPFGAFEKYHKGKMAVGDTTAALTHDFGPVALKGDSLTVSNGVDTSFGPWHDEPVKFGIFIDVFSTRASFLTHDEFGKSLGHDGLIFMIDGSKTRRVMSEDVLELDKFKKYVGESWKKTSRIAVVNKTASETIPREEVASEIGVEPSDVFYVDSVADINSKEAFIALITKKVKIHEPDHVFGVN